MPSTTYSLFRDAILAERQVTCVYDGRYRELCPHIIGTSKGGEEAVLAWQFAGESSGPLPQWRCLRLRNVTQARARAGRVARGQLAPHRADLRQHHRFRRERACAQAAKAHRQECPHLERFRAKWIPVRVKKMHQNKNLELRFDSIGTEIALDDTARMPGMRKLAVVPIGRSHDLPIFRIILDAHPKSAVFSAPSRLGRRGASRSSRHARRDAMDAGMLRDEQHDADGEVVWSWRRDAGVKLVMMLRITRVTGARKPAPRGEHV
jgi:hypothetical protein